MEDTALCLVDNSLELRTIVIIILNKLWIHFGFFSSCICVKVITSLLILESFYKVITMSSFNILSPLSMQSFHFHLLLLLAINLSLSLFNFTIITGRISILTPAYIPPPSNQLESFPFNH